MTQIYDLAGAMQYIENLLDEKDDDIQDLKDQVGRLEMEVSDLQDELQNEIG